MATATKTRPEEQEAPAAETLAPKERKVRAFFKRMGRKMQKGVKNVSLKIRAAGYKSATQIKKSSRFVAKKADRSARWLGLTALITARGAAFYLMRGLGYITFGLTWLVWAVVRVIALVISVVLFAITLVILFVLIVLMTLILAFRRYVVGTLRWISLGWPGSLRAATMRKPGQEKATRQNIRNGFLNSMEKMLQTLFDDDKIEIWDHNAADMQRDWRTSNSSVKDDFDHHPDEVADYDKLEYSQLCSHRDHADWLYLENKEPLLAAHWLGRTYFLEEFYKDNDMLDQVDFLYNKWKKESPLADKVTRGGVNKNEFRKGMEAESEIMKTQVRRKQTWGMTTREWDAYNERMQKRNKDHEHLKSMSDKVHWKDVVDL